MMMMMMMKMKIVALIFPGRSLHLGQMILAVGSPSSGTKRKDRRIATPMNKRHSSSALGSSASSSRGAERKRKRKRGDLKWRQGISIGQHSYYVASGTFVAVRCVRQAAVHSNFCKSYMCRDCNGQIRDASLYL